MIKLFRKTRKRLLAENKFSRYLIYAVGEIILVVIGILIALKVNNYNIQELNNEKFETIFHEVKENIIADIKSVEIAINYYNTKDSLIQLVRNDKVTKQMYLENQTLFYLLYYYRSHSLHDNGYNMLSQNLDVIPQKYDTVMPYLNRIYSSQRKVLEDFNKYIIDYTYRMLERWADKNSYFTLSKEEKIDFFLNNSSFKNDAILYTRFSQDMFVRNMHNYIYNATSVFNLLEEMDNKSNFDNVSIYNDLIKKLDTIQLVKNPEQDDCSMIDENNNSYPTEKNIFNRSSIFIKNDLKDRVYLQKGKNSSVKNATIYMPKYIEPNKTIYLRPVVNHNIKVLTKEGKYMGIFCVPKQGGVVLLK